jgi:hypothetical protein
MPMCTSSTRSDVWSCPFCDPIEPRNCYQVIPAENGQGYKVPCSSIACRSAGFKTSDCGEFAAHLAEEHPDLSIEDWDTANAALNSLPVPEEDASPVPLPLVGSVKKTRPKRKTKRKKRKAPKRRK